MTLNQLEKKLDSLDEKIGASYDKFDAAYEKVTYAVGVIKVLIADLFEVVDNFIEEERIKK